MVQVPNRAYSTQETLLIESPQRERNYENILRQHSVSFFTAFATKSIKELSILALLSSYPR